MPNSLPSAPIIVGGSPSVGSHLLMTLLSRVPGVVVGPELGVLDKPYWLEAPPHVYRKRVSRWLKVGYPRPFVGVTRPAFVNLSDYGMNQAELLALSARASDYPGLLRSFFDGHVAASKGRRWLEKTPGNIFAFPQIQKAFPEARFIQLIRDGRDVVVSLRRRGHSPFRAAARWYYATLVGLEYRNWENCLTIKYEELVASPRQVMIEICAFLGESFDDAVLVGRPGTQPRVPTWNASPEGDIATTGVGRYKHGLGTEEASALRNVRLTARTPVAAITPLDLLNQLGYTTEVIDGAGEPSWALRAAALREVTLDHGRSLVQFRKIVPCPVRLD